MKKATLATLSLVLAASALISGCTEGRRARQETKFVDRPADITCWSYGTEVYQGRSTGTVEHDSGRVSFVDAATGRFTTISANCRVIYLAKAK